MKIFALLPARGWCVATLSSPAGAFTAAAEDVSENIAEIKIDIAAASSSAESERVLPALEGISVSVRAVLAAAGEPRPFGTEGIVLFSFFGIRENLVGF